MNEIINMTANNCLHTELFPGTMIGGKALSGLSETSGIDYSLEQRLRFDENYQKLKLEIEQVKLEIYVEEKQQELISLKNKLYKLKNK